MSVYDFKVEQRALELEQIDKKVEEKQGEALHLADKITVESEELEHIKEKKSKVKKVEEIQGKPSLVGNKVTVDEEVFREVKVLATKQIVGETKEKKLKKELIEANQKIEQKDLQIVKQSKEISSLKSVSSVLKSKKEIVKLQEELNENKKELTYLRRFKEEIQAIFKLDKVKEFFENIGLLVRIQELIQEKMPPNRKEHNNDSR